MCYYHEHDVLNSSARIRTQRNGKEGRGLRSKGFVPKKAQKYLPSTKFVFPLKECFDGPGGGGRRVVTFLLTFFQFKHKAARSHRPHWGWPWPPA